MLIENLIRFIQVILLVALQVLLMNHIHFMGYGSPLVYVALLLYFPANSGRIGPLCWSFVIGTLVDLFSNTPGLSAASLTFAAMFQPGWLKILTPKDAVEDMTPSYRTMGVFNHMRYFTFILLIHHVAYYLLESFSFYNLTDLAIACGSSFLLSWVAIAALEALRGHGR